MTTFKSICAVGGLAVAAAVSHVPTATALPGDLLATVTLPGNSPLPGIDDGSVGGTTIPGGPSGIVYITPRETFIDDTWDIYVPPAGLGPQVAALLATKNFVDSGTGDPVALSCGTWDPTRNVLWAAVAGATGPVYSVDLGDLTASGDAIATHEFDSEVGGLTLCDGIAYDEERDTLWISPDVDHNVYEYDLGGGIAGFGNQIRAIAPKNAAGGEDGDVSGVTVGSDNTLYIGRNGNAEIRRINKDTGAHIADFATTTGRDEDLTCDPATYAPLEAILSKDAYDGYYEAFEVEEGTCPLPPIRVMIDIKFLSNPNGFNCKKHGVLPVTLFGMENFDVTLVDISTVQLVLAEDLGDDPSGVPALEPNFGYVDRGAPSDKGASEGAYVDGVEQDYLNPDGIDDLELHFDAQEVVDLIDCDELDKKEASPTLAVIGNLTNGLSFQSVPIGDVGIDQLYIQNK